MKRFIAVITGYPKASSLLPTEDFFLYPCRIAEELGFQPEMWTLRTGDLKPEEVVNGVKVRRFRNAWQLYKNLKAKDIGFIYAVLRPHMPSLLAGLTDKPKVFMTSSYEIGSTWLIGKISLFFLKRFDRLMMSTPYEMECYKRYGIPEKKLVLIPCAVDQRFFSKKLDEGMIRRKHGIEKKFTIITIANFRSCKNLDVMIKAFKRFNEQVPDSQFLVIGQDKLKDKDNYKEQESSATTVEELVKESRNVVWLGHRSPEEIREFLNISDVYILSSYIESQGLTNYEAASAGKAICLSTLGTFTTVFGDCALFHDPFDDKKLAENLMVYYNDEKLRKENGSKAQELMKAWDYPVIKEKLKNLYKQLL